MKQLKVLSVSYQLANLSIREQFYLTPSNADLLIQRLQQKFKVDAVLILATCNRTEIYFESELIQPEDVLNEWIILRGIELENPSQYCHQINETVSSTEYIMKVASGLESMVLGDMQIIAQMKEAYQASLAKGMQGKLLERAMQTVFRMHKRIQNETAFRTGSASLSYLALDTLRQLYGKEELKAKKLLLVGAGNIATEVAKYIHKFPFLKVAITNRTDLKAERLANKYKLSFIPWEHLSKAVFEYDFVVTGINTEKPLFTHKSCFNFLAKEKVFVDLGVPTNVCTELEQNPLIKVVNVDTLRAKAEKANQDRMEAVGKVEGILAEELEFFNEWWQKVPANEAIKKLKMNLEEIVKGEMLTSFAEFLSEEEMEKVAERIGKRFLKQPAKRLNNPNQNYSVETIDALGQLFT